MLSECDVFLPLLARLHQIAVLAPLSPSSQLTYANASSSTLHGYGIVIVEACKIMEMIEVTGARKHILLNLTVIVICERVCVTADGGRYVVGPLCVV